MSYTSPTMAVVSVLRTSSASLFSSVIAAKAGLTPKKVTRIIDRLLNRKLINREKARHPMRYYKYSMTDDQHKSFLSRTNQTALKCLDIDQKLDFLMLVRRNSMYSDHPMIGKIISDYHFLKTEPEDL